MKIVKVKFNDMGPWLALEPKDFGPLKDEIEESEEGDCYTLEITEMSEEEFKNLPDHDGW